MARFSSVQATLDGTRIAGVSVRNCTKVAASKTGTATPSSTKTVDWERRPPRSRRRKLSQSTIPSFDRVQNRELLLGNYAQPGTHGEVPGTTEFTASRWIFCLLRKLQRSLANHAGSDFHPVIGTGEGE